MASNEWWASFALVFFGLLAARLLSTTGQSGKSVEKPAGKRQPIGRKAPQ